MSSALHTLIQSPLSTSTHPNVDTTLTKAREYPRLLADIGGTNARFALESAAGQYESITVLLCNDYPSLLDATQAYLAGLALADKVRHAAFAIANPIQGDWVRMTNHHWEFSIEATRQGLGLDTFLLMNDFKALAMALPHLTSDQKQQVGRGVACALSTIGLLGAGTGLGVSAIVPAGQYWTALEGEGGHVTFAPADETEIEILRFAWREHTHVSAERLLSGSGLELIYRALASRAGDAEVPLSAPEIVQRALTAQCSICDQTITHFCNMLGTIAGNLALTLGARGGLYIGGGIVPRLGQRFIQSGFRQRFESKGRFSDYLTQIPTYIITAQYPAFVGISSALQAHLKSATANIFQAS